jgi:signal transduction histidine kinase
MKAQFANITSRWSLVQQFTFASLIIMLLGMAGIGRWVGEKIEIGVIKEATAATALYMDSFISPNLQELAQSKSLTPDHMHVLNDLFSKNNLGDRTISIKIWDKDNHVIYSNIPSLIDRVFPDNPDLTSAFNGEVTGEISSLQEAENVEERRLSSDPLLEIYSPVRRNDSNQVIAVAEFYQKIDTLEAEIAAAQTRGWLVVGTSMAVMYLLLVGFVRWISHRIGQQELELEKQVAQLTQLLSHNRELSTRLRHAAANTTALNENLLRRTSAELHDGPVQGISLALLRLDRAMSENEVCRLVKNSKCTTSLPTVQASLQTALQDLRIIAAGLALPQLDGLTLPEVFSRAVRLHEQRTRTKVTLSMQDIPDQATLPVKITAYRLIQEGLNNAYRHAGGAGQEVQVACKSNQIQIEVLDQGPGFNVGMLNESDKHLGLVGMRQRIESLGGLFMIKSKIRRGTRLIARLPLQAIGENAYG